MELKQLTDNVFYYPHQPDTDRPMLAYIKGEKFSIVIDAGNSSNHVDEFYKSLEDKGLEMPKFTVITHWHWDHTFGMHKIHGFSIAHYKTNEFLNQEKAKCLDNTYVDFLKTDDKCFSREYTDNSEVVVVSSDIQFKEALILDLGGISAKIYHTISPHSQDSVLIYVPEEKTLFLGDSTSEDFFNDGYMDKDKLKLLINTIENTDCQYCILSHTDPLQKTDLLNYLNSL